MTTRHPVGSIEPYETAKGKRYRVRYRKPDHSQGAKRGFATKRDAERWMREVEGSKDRGQFIDSADARVTIDTLGPGWLLSQTHLKPSSLRPVEDAWRLRVQPKWGAYPVSAIRHSDVQAWVSTMSKERSATVVIRTHGVLASILDSAVRDRRILANPAREITLPRKSSRRHVYLNHEQVHRLAGNSGDKATLVLTLAYTGLRWGEAVALRLSHLDFEKGRINVLENAVEVANVIHVGTPKTHKTRSVPMPAFLAPYLLAQTAGRSKNDLVFAGRDGEYMKRTRVSEGSKSWFKSALAASSLEPMTLHDLRHSAASLAVSAGANVKAVQRMLGHASAAMTLDRYADLFDDDLDAVAARLDDAVMAASVSNLCPLPSNEQMEKPSASA